MEDESDNKECEAQSYLDFVDADSEPSEDIPVERLTDEDRNYEVGGIETVVKKVEGVIPPPVNLNIPEKQHNSYDVMHLVNTQLTDLVEKSKHQKLDYTDTKRLEILAKVNKLIFTSPENVTKDEDDEYSDEEVELFVANLAEWKNNGKKE